MPSHQNLALNCSSRWRYKGSKIDSIPYKPFKIRLHMNVVPRSTRNKKGEQRINSQVQIKVLIKPMDNPLGVSPIKGNQGTTRGKDKIF